MRSRSLTSAATIAVVRVQSANYQSYSYHGSARSDARNEYDVVTIRDIEKDDDFAALTKLPQVSGVASLKRILMDPRCAAISNSAKPPHSSTLDLLLFYAFRHQLRHRNAIRPLGVIALGLFPNRNAKVAAAVSATSSWTQRRLHLRRRRIRRQRPSTRQRQGVGARPWTMPAGLSRTGRLRRSPRRIPKSWPGVVAMYDQEGSEGQGG